MLISMTGFGSASSTAGGKRITVEIKSVNHRFGEVVVRIPRAYTPLEERVRKAVLRKVSRGRFDVTVNLVNEGDRTSLVKVDKALAMDYYKSLRELGEIAGISSEITAEQLSRFPQVLTLEEAEDDLEELWLGLQKALEEALAGLLSMRRLEGANLEADIVHRIGNIEQFIKGISSREQNVVESYRERLQARIAELLGDAAPDEMRIVQEVTIFADRSNITEELVRLQSHLEQFGKMIGSNEPVGRKLDFMIQEIHREVSTISAKANDAGISHLVVDIKGELEKVREQVQNVE
ncbi:MAG: YicC family protein [Firmicutes bacterium]|nr:YicC family protein [Bacillota bacterium]